MADADRRLSHEIPPYSITVGNIYFCLIKNKTSTTIEFDDTVIEVPMAKTVALSQNTASQDIWASGALLATLVRTNYLEISLATVSLPQHLINAIEGAESVDGITINKTNDVEREFAFGFWAENNDGSHVSFWLPVCKLIPSEKSYTTRTADLPDPEVSYTVRGIPFDNVLRVRVSSDDAKKYEINLPDAREFSQQFFLTPMYRMEQVQTLVSKYRTVADGAVAEFATLATALNKKDDKK